MSAGPQQILLVTGMSGAGKSTVLKTLEDLGWETVDNLPLPLLDRLLAAPEPVGAGEARPLAVGFGARTRDFAPARIIARRTSPRIVITPAGVCVYGWTATTSNRERAPATA